MILMTSNSAVSVIPECKGPNRLRDLWEPSYRICTAKLQAPALQAFLDHGETGLPAMKDIITTVFVREPKMCSLCGIPTFLQGFLGILWDEDQTLFQASTTWRSFEK
ncbi:uncharacterized protein ACIB01_006664 isoform 1-T1 [Guaruba guarouba]